jgi:lipoprotein-anchoring transpeptidase ErfK/SrfK
MSKKKLYFLIFGILIAIFLVLEGIGTFLGSRLTARWKALSVEQKDLNAGADNRIDTVKALQRKIQRLEPKGLYIVIDSGKNILYLKKGDAVRLEAVVSCGSGNVLQEPDGKRSWVFDTPKGVFTVTSKLRDPSWIKPDWAFIEEAKSIPKNPQERVEEGVLGDYALGFGDGYFIHGTLYTRLLGRNVTHGCIRVGDEDLKKLFLVVTIGTPIFIY